MFAFRVIDRSIMFEIHLTENQNSWSRHTPLPLTALVIETLRNKFEGGTGCANYLLEICKMGRRPILNMSVSIKYGNENWETSSTVIALQKCIRVTQSTWKDMGMKI